MHPPAINHDALEQSAVRRRAGHHHWIERCGNVGRPAPEMLAIWVAPYRFIVLRATAAAVDVNRHHQPVPQNLQILYQLQFDIVITTSAPADEFRQREILRQIAHNGSPHRHEIPAHPAAEHQSENHQ